MPNNFSQNQEERWPFFKSEPKYRDIDQGRFFDSAVLPGFAEHRFEGRIEKPIVKYFHHFKEFFF